MTERLFFTVVIATVRVMRTVLPAPLTVVPQARRFETRRSLRRSG